MWVGGEGKKVGDPIIHPVLDVLSLGRASLVSRN